MSVRNMVCWVVVVAGAGRAAADDWSDRSVLARKPGPAAKVEAGGKSVSVSLNGDVFTVLKDDKAGLLVRGGDGKEGRVEKADFVPADEAVAYFSGLIKADAKNGWAFRQRGAARVLVGDIDDALKDFDEAIRLDPKDAAAYGGRGNVRFARGELDKAADDFGRAIDLNPKDAEAHSARGAARHAAAELDAALDDFDAAVRLDPACEAYRLNRAAAWYDKGKMAKALEDFDAAVRIDPKSLRALSGRARVRFESGDYAKAVADYDELVRLEPGNPGLYQDRGSARRLAGDYAKAMADYDEALRLDPKHVGALACKAYLLAACPVEKHRDGKAALELAKKAHDLNDRVGWVMRSLSAAYAELGDFAEAAFWQKKALDEDEAYAADPREKAEAAKRLKAYADKKPYREEAK